MFVVVAQYVSESVYVHRMHILELISLGLDNLKLQFCIIVEELRSAECGGTLSGVGPHPVAGWSDDFSLSTSSFVKFTSSVGNQ